MEQQLSLLIALQEADQKVRGLKEKQKRFPEIMASFERRRKEAGDELNVAREGLNTAQKNKRDRDQDLEAGVQKVEKLKARASEIKTNKEYQAMLKEVETAEQENKAVEDDILSLMEKIDAAAALIAVAEKRAHEEDTAMMAEQKEQEEISAAVEEELREALEQRRKTAAGIEPRILEKYEKLLKSAGTALAEARAESCSGCFMSVPPQVFVNVKKNSSMINCPHCGRILYYKG